MSLFVVETPHFNNECGHKKEEYIGTISYFDEQFEEIFFDVYVFKGSLGDEVCIRYGNEGSQYYSPTDLFTFLSIACKEDTVPAYKQALIVLREKGRLSFNKIQ